MPLRLPGKTNLCGRCSSELRKGCGSTARNASRWTSCGIVCRKCTRGLWVSETKASSRPCTSAWARRLIFPLLRVNYLNTRDVRASKSEKHLQNLVRGQDAVWDKRVDKFSRRLHLLRVGVGIVAVTCVGPSSSFLALYVRITTALM